jgi:hypothetical protein
MVQRKSYSRKSKIISYRVPNDIYYLAEALAQNYNMSVYDFAKAIFIKYLKAKGYIP